MKRILKYIVSNKALMAKTPLTNDSIGFSCHKEKKGFYISEAERAFWEDKATIVIVVRNGSSTLDLCFDGLESQHYKQYIHEILFIDDSSSDDTVSKIKKFSTKENYRVKLIQNFKSQGLAKNYNYALKKVSTPYCILMHQDIVLSDPDSYGKILHPFFRNPNVVISHPVIIHPFRVWLQYNIWQKLLIGRLVNKPYPKFSGKFDAIKIIPNLYFDEISYRTAGEDLDYEQRARKYGVVENSNLVIEHIHSLDSAFNWRDFLKKESQLAECYGVNFRRYFSSIPVIDSLLLLFRIFLLALQIVVFFNPLLSLLVMLLIGVYLILYPGKTYIYAFPDFRVFMIPIITYISLYYYSYYFIRGFVHKKQLL